MRLAVVALVALVIVAGPALGEFEWDEEQAFSDALSQNLNLTIVAWAVENGPGGLNRIGRRIHHTAVLKIDSFADQPTEETFRAMMQAWSEWKTWDLTVANVNRDLLAADRPLVERLPSIAPEPPKAAADAP